MGNNIFKLSIVVVLCSTIVSCDIMDSRNLKVWNNSRDTISYFCETGISDFKKVIYSPLEQDKIYNGKDTIRTTQIGILFPNDSSFFRSYNWEVHIKESENKQVVIFFFKIKTLRENDWNELREKVICDKKIALTYEELEKLNWKVVYDGK